MRCRMVEQAAAEHLELQLNRLRHMLQHVPQQWQLTETRVSDERRRGDERQERERSTCANDLDRAERNRRRAEEAAGVVQAASGEVWKIQRERMAREIPATIDERKVFEGLETLVVSLRSGSLGR